MWVGPCADVSVYTVGDYIIYCLIMYFQPVELLIEDRCDVVMSWGYGNSMGESNVRSLEVVYLDDVIV